MAKKKNKKLAKQMAMFEEGGLKDEGGSTDPISGNDVPIGSTKEEVRDDIPAQLSEGEFVFPADVVRFLGLEKLMMMRQEAKAGLKRMEDMGQMGNSEEATISDDVPFDMSDLDMEDDKEEEVPDSNFNRGGVVTMAEGGTTPTTENTDLNNTQTNNITNNQPKQKSLNVRQAQVPIRNVSNLPDAKTFLSKKPTAKPVDYKSLIPQGEGNRFKDIVQSRINQNKSIEDTKKELDDILTINPYSNDNGSDDNGSTFSDGIPQGGINYADTQRFDMPDRARDALNSFSKSQLSMFSVLNPTNSAFSVFASAAGAGLANITNGKSANIIGGPVMAAEKGKAEAIAFNTAMIDIQRDFGIKVGTPMHEWGEKAINQIGIRGEYALKTGGAIHNAKYNLPYESSITEEDRSFMDKVKEKFNGMGIDFLGNPSKKEDKSLVMGTEKTDPTNAAFIGPMSYDNDRAYYDSIGAIIAAEIQVEKISNEEMGGITGFGFEDSSMVQDLTELGFSTDTRDEISANGGSIGIKYNDNGQAYSVNDNGSFTHTDGTTVNFTDSKGNPGNAPSTPDPSPPPAPPPSRPSRPSTPSNNNNSNENNDNPGGSDNSSGAGAESGVGGWT